MSRMLSRYNYSTEAGSPKKVLGVFFAAHEYAKNPEFLGCVENALGIREWLESKGHKYVVTSDKNGPDSVLTPPPSISTPNSHACHN